MRARVRDVVLALPGAGTAGAAAAATERALAGAALRAMRGMAVGAMRMPCGPIGTRLLRLAISLAAHRIADRAALVAIEPALAVGATVGLG